MEAARVRMMVKWSVLPGESKPIVSVLQGLMISTRAEPGCLGCSLSTDVSNGVVIHYTEEWSTEEDLNRQLRSDNFGVLAELMERASEHPSIEFALTRSIRGLDYAQEIRGTTRH
jgi:quinol monooxygenase YgiN